MDPAFFVLVSVPLLYVALQLSALRRMRNGWRWAAVLPVFAMVAALGVFVIGIATDTSMAVLGLVIGLPAATLYLLCLVPLHWMVARD
jgi:hypothetical protein